MQMKDVLRLAREVSHSEKGKHIGRRNFANGTIAMLPVIIGQLNQNAQDPLERQKLDQALIDHMRDNYETKSFIDGFKEDEARKMIAHIFHNDPSPLEKVAESTGLEAEKNTEIMLILVPLVVAYLARRKKESHLKAADLIAETATLQKDAQSLSGPAQKLLNQKHNGLLKSFFK